MTHVIISHLMTHVMISPQVARMPLLEEAIDVVSRVAVLALYACGRRVTHGDEAGCDVG